MAAALLALCDACLARAGDDIVPGDNVICKVDESCSGTVDRLTDEILVVVRTGDSNEAWVPPGGVGASGLTSSHCALRRPTAIDQGPCQSSRVPQDAEGVVCGEESGEVVINQRCYDKSIRGRTAMRNFMVKLVHECIHP